MGERTQVGGMDERQQQYLDAMGIQVWVQRTGPESVVADPPCAPAAVPAAVSPVVVTPEISSPALIKPAEAEAEDSLIATLSWEGLANSVERCGRCPERAAKRTATFLGEGQRQADIMVIAENPGADEGDEHGVFDGRVGQLLDDMLRAMGLGREQVYMTTALKSRLPDTREPTREEVARCAPYLLRQIALVRPRLILVFGRVAAQALLNTDAPMTELRGIVHRYGDTPMVVTYHPAYLLSASREKRGAWEDLKLAMRTLREFQRE